MCFGYTDLYPSGGTSDVVESFDTEEEAAHWLGSKGYEHTISYVFDRVEGETYDIVIQGKLSNHS